MNTFGTDTGPTIFIRNLRNIKGPELLKQVAQVKRSSEKPPSHLLKVKIWKKLAFKPYEGTQLITSAAEHPALVFSSDWIDPTCLSLPLEHCRASFAPIDNLTAPSPIQDLCTNP